MFPKSTWLFFVSLFFITSQVVADNIEIDGVNDKEIVELIKSQIISKDKYSSENQESISNKFFIDSDKKTILTILHSFGYFDAEVESSEENDELFFKITLNERYKFNEVLLRYVDQKDFRSGLKIGQVFELINIDFDTFTTTKAIAKASLKIRDFLQGCGFAFVEIKQPIVEIDKKNKKIKVIYEVLLNKKTIIDKTIIKIKSKKDPKLLEPFVRNRITWKDGSVYNAKDIEAFKDNLMNSGIFHGIDVKLSDPTQDKQDDKITHTTAIVQVEEALLRNIELGLKYGTTEKLGTHFAWTHYNIDGKGSKLTALLDTSNLFHSKRREISTQLKYSNYDLFYKNQELKNRVWYTTDKDSASYHVSKVGCEAVLWQNFGKGFKAGAGGCFENAVTTDLIDNWNKGKTKFKAFGIPIGAEFDTTDFFLDPQKGIRCSGMATPYIGKKPLTILTGKASIYIPISKNTFKNPVVIALYTSGGSILNRKASGIPRDKMFFGGGANSIRGYGYQKLGALTDDKQPYGGESAFEIGIEPRIRVSENVGLVAFVEGGNVYSSKVPKPLKKLLWGYGLGVRYYTPLGPIRLDLAFPAKRRKSSDGKKRLDSAFQIYISIGQAF